MLRIAVSSVRRCSAKRPLSRTFSSPPPPPPPPRASPGAEQGVIILGGLGMKQRALDKIAATLYPDLPVLKYTHSLAEIVGVVPLWSRNLARFSEALAAFPGGAILHIFSGASFFSTFALSEWRDARIRGVVLDSVPFLRVERQLMRVVDVPEPLCGPLAHVARALLVSPLIGATIAKTDRYQELQREPSTFMPARHVLAAHSADDVIVPIEQFRTYVAAVRARGDWHVRAAHGQLPLTPGSNADKAPIMTVYEGKGRHACLAMDDEPSYKAAVRSWLATTGFVQK